MEPPVSSVWATHSSRLRDPAALDPAPGPARALRLLDAARPGDVDAVTAVLEALSPDALAEAVSTIALPLAPAVIAAMLAGPSSAARDVLSCRLVQQPEAVPVRTMGLSEFLRTLEEAAADGYRNITVSRLRALALEALRTGTLTAEQVVEHARPAVLAVTLAVCTPEEYVRPGARRATGDVRVLIRNLLNASLGEDHDLWSTVLETSGSFDGTFIDLVAAAIETRRAASHGPAHGTLEPSSGFRRFFASPRTHHNPQNLLLGLAPPAVAERHLRALHDAPTAVASGAAQYRWGWMLTNGPLTRPLVDHVLARGAVAQRRWLVRNELLPDSALEQAGPGYAQELLLRKVAPPRFRRAAFRALDRDPQQVRTWAQNLTGERRDQLLDLVWGLTASAADAVADTTTADDAAIVDAVTLRLTVAAVGGRVDEPTLVCAYGALACAAGPEPVWALELQRVGRLDQALPAVRACLLTGTADPLVEAARQVPRRHWLDALSDEDHRYQALRTDAELDRTGHFPREALVAAHLDGRPDRWREVARRLASGTAAPVEAVIRDVANRPSYPVPRFTTLAPLRGHTKIR